MSFREFMAAALYEPGLGYYTSAGRKVGAEGDFYTSSNVHALFGRTIARELVRMWENLGSPDHHEIVEVGAAGGQLALDILDAIRDLSPPCYGGVTYRLIEAEPSLREVQQLKLASHLTHLAWSSPAELATGSIRFIGTLLSNELIDALPVHLVEMTREGLREVMVDFDGASFVERLLPPSTPELAERFTSLGLQLIPGQRGEINLESPRWLAGVAAALERGFVLTIDYGHPAQELYAAARMNGTLLCYHCHSTSDDPYLRVGEQDITSHVDFTTLMQWGERLGLSTVWFGEQYRFLMSAGIMEELMALEARATSEQEVLKHRLAMKKLILPDGGMGDTFKVLIQSKGVHTPTLLCMRKLAEIF
ncbi:MAG TPA: SAM-dependent methyltransferase, partial [Geobacterales bacterium]|nr:SAM-dependent methyltransferase [Geobacterales bacterium]